MKKLRFQISLLLLALLASGCNPLTGTTVTPIVATIQPPAAPQLPTPTPASQISPTATPNPFPDPVLVINGQEEVVFDWSTDRCAKENLPDLPSRAYRDVNGQVQLILSHFTSYRMTGPSLNELEIDCNPMMKSTYDPDPSQFSDAEWIASAYTEDGQTVYALVHTEYQGHTHTGRCPQGEYFPCWYNSLTMAFSTDGGETFQHIVEPPAHRVAGLPYPYEAGSGPYGIFEPSNIIKGQDGYYYAFGRLDYYKSDEQGVCLMRSDDLSDPTSWRFWTGSNFSGRFIDPYTEEVDDLAAYVCPPLEWDDIGASLNSSITYSTYLNRYVLVGLSADWLDDREVWGVYYSFSDDLIHWTRRKLLVELPLPWTTPNFDDVMYLYPSLLDPQSDSRNFETVGKTAYLYTTRLNFGQANLDRDLIRVPVEFFPSEEAVPIASTTIEAEETDAVALRIVKDAFTVPIDIPTEQALVLEVKAAKQAAGFLTNTRFLIYLNGELLLDVMDFWSEIRARGDGFSTL